GAEVILEGVLDVASLVENLVGPAAVVDVVAEQAIDDVVHVLMFGEKDVAAQVKAVAVLPEGTAQTARHRGPLQHLGGVPQEAVQRQAADAAAQDADVHRSLPWELAFSGGSETRAGLGPGR